mmetsp:Transcript_52322/g.126531  ORF Transcript_52322/g.126531 Transcript_52322/m.126531 type:complete len:712 (+) Transcript_52322:267-2402(+)
MSSSYRGSRSSKGVDDARKFLNDDDDIEGEEYLDDVETTTIIAAEGLGPAGGRNSSGGDSIGGRTNLSGNPSNGGNSYTETAGLFLTEAVDQTSSRLSGCCAAGQAWLGKGGPNRKRNVSLVVAGITVAAVVLGVVFGTGGSGSSASSSYQAPPGGGGPLSASPGGSSGSSEGATTSVEEQASASKHPNYYYEMYDWIVHQLKLSEADPFSDPDSPQSLALSWLINVDQSHLGAVASKSRKKYGTLSEHHLLHRYVLGVFYYATTLDEDQFGVTEWQSSDNWLSEEHVCDGWYGVECQEVSEGEAVEGDEESRFVYSLTLSRNSLKGTLPGELMALTDLQRLDLEYNTLRGTIPGTQMSQMSKLADLRLRNNKLTGTIPGKEFQTGPIAKSLQQVSLGYNELRGHIPAEIQHWINLRDLSLQHNQLEGNFPSSLVELTKIEKLICNDNNLNGAFGQTVARVLNKLTTLKELDLSNNHITGNMPSSEKSFGGSFDALTNLEVLSLSNMNLKGSIPEHWFNKLTLLRELRFDSNSFTGTIPATVGYLSNNEVFDLSNNEFTGRIPHQIAVLPVVYLQNNSLTGPIQGFDDGAPKNTRFLLLQNNKIGGNLPDSFANLQQLEECHLDQNNLTGNIPSSFGRMTNLKHIRFQQNGFRGRMPDEVCQLRPSSSNSTESTDADNGGGGGDGSGKLLYLGADCAEQGTFKCDCCSKCF